MADDFLHPENTLAIPLIGQLMLRRLQRRVIATAEATKTAIDPDVSVVIRSRNNSQQLSRLLKDIREQRFSGKVEIIVVDTESSDNSVAIAKQAGAKVVSIKQADFDYPKSLNAGFRAATKSWVFSFVDHSALSSRYALKTASRWDGDPKIAAVWALPLPNRNASIWERLAYLAWLWYGLRPAHITKKRETGAGFLAANDSVIRRSAWQDVGGFDERYGAGGEDAALGRVLLAAGFRTIYDPTLSVYHSHGLGLINSFRQLRYWFRLSKPSPFDRDVLERFRSNL